MQPHDQRGVAGLEGAKDTRVRMRLGVEVKVLRSARGITIDTETTTRTTTSTAA